MGIKPRKQRPPPPTRRVGNVIMEREEGRKRQPRQLLAEEKAEEHKLYSNEETVCGLPIGADGMVTVEGDSRRGRSAYDTWLRVDCNECWALRESRPGGTVCIVEDGAASGGFASDERFDGERMTLCGEVADGFDTNDEHGEVDCPDCLSLITPRSREHKRDPGGNHNSTLCGKANMHQFPTHLRWQGVNCIDCLRVSEHEPVEDYIEDAAAIVLHNSLAAMRGRGLEVTRELCNYCGKSPKTAGTICVVCAPVVHRDRYLNDVDVEVLCAQILGVPPAWIIDLATGFDGDGHAVAYPNAFALGKKLARKHRAKKGTQ